jgi:hypothetical protein
VRASIVGRTDVARHAVVAQRLSASKANAWRIAH